MASVVVWSVVSARGAPRRIDPGVIVVDGLLIGGSESGVLFILTIASHVGS